MKVLYVKPMEKPVVKNIGTKLEDLQKEVEGWIQIVYPFDDSVCIICNEEAKITGMDLNRGLKLSDCGEEENDELYDIIAGPFLVVGLGDDSDFRDLTEEEIQKYEKRFHYPEMFYKKRNGELGIIKLGDD